MKKISNKCNIGIRNIHSVKVIGLFLGMIIMAVFTFSCKKKIENKTEPEVKQPNIVLFFVDDYGWSDIGYRNPSFKTPNLNQLKKESMEFVRAYIPTPTCSPSRYSLLTGREAVRAQMVRHINMDSTGPNAKYNYWETDPVQMPSINYMPLEDVTYAEKLKEYGYYNMFIGKWHLGHPGHYPNDQGFDEVYGTTNSGHPKNYYYPFFKNEDDPKSFFKSGFEEGDYLTDVLTDKAVNFIAEYDKNQPFMLSFWYYSVHEPSTGRKDLVQKYLDAGLSGRYAEHHAMVEAMDESVGRVRKALENKGMADDTVIIFLSDQGGAYQNTPLAGGKRGGNTLGEGGARVPFMMYYPGRTTPNTTSRTPIQSIDVFPTLIEIASGKSYTNDDKIQGVSLLPILEGKSIADRNLYFFRSYEDQYSSVMSGDWKLIKYHSGKLELFNVNEDISETHNLSGQGLEIEDTLKKDIQEWENRAVPEF